LVVREAARAAQIDTEDVTLHTTYLGGGFGRRLEVSVAVLAVQAAVAMEGRPVKLVLSREEDTRHDAFRPLAIARARGVATEDGPDALEIRVASPSLVHRDRATDSPEARQALNPDKFLTIGLREQPYELPDYRIAAHMPQNMLWVGWLRGVAESQNVFFHETAIDELCALSGQDPLSARLAKLRHGPSRLVLETVANMSNWGAPLPEGHGRGVAFAISSDAATAQVVEVRAEGPDRIAVQDVWIAADVGIALDPRNIEAQLEGACIYGLTAAMMGEITVAGAAVQQSNFHDYRILRMSEVPRIHTQAVESGAEIFGVGETGTPPVAPALGNAIFAATGRRLRHLPFERAVRFV